MPFALHAETLGTVSVCALSGQLDSRAAGTFERELAAVLGQDKRSLLLDCRELEFITSAGLRVLLMAGKRLSAEGGGMALCALNAATRQVFDIAGFSGIFQIRATRDEALAWLVESAASSRTADVARSLLKRDEAPARAEAHAGSLADRSDRSDLAAELLKPKQ
jgi:anti-anti-sigma factor